jgi:hypothetical protein
MLKIILGKDSLNELSALSGSELWIFLQKVTHGDETLLRGFEFGPFHNIEPDIINVKPIDAIETTA